MSTLKEHFVGKLVYEYGETKFCVQFSNNCKQISFVNDVNRSHLGVPDNNCMSSGWYVVHFKMTMHESSN